MNTPAGNRWGNNVLGGQDTGGLQPTGWLAAAASLVVLQPCMPTLLLA